MFLTRSIGADRGPLDDFWYMPAGGRTVAGARVSADSAMRLSAVFKCVRVLAETLGMLPLHVYRRLDKGKERAASHPLAELLQVQPNPWQTAMQWREMKMGHLALRGNAYSRIVFNGAGREEALLPLNPDGMRVEVGPSGLPRYHYTPAGGGREQVYVFGEVLHIAGLSADGYVGINPIEFHREAIGAAMATRDYGARYFENDAKPAGWVEFAGKFADAEARQKWRSSWRETYGGQNRNSVAVLENGMKYHEIGVKNTDAQFLDSRKYQDIDIAGLFRMQPHKVGILSEAKWANIEQQSLEFVQDTMLPWCVRWEQCTARDLQFGDGYFAEFLLQMLLRGDTKTRYEAYGMAIKDGWMVRNEVRSLENLNPLEGLDKPLEPLNMGRANERRQSDQPPSTRSQREQALAMAAAQRVVNKETAALSKDYERARAAQGTDTPPAAFERTVRDFYALHVDYVATVMACPHPQAEAYCEASRTEVLGALSAELATGARCVLPLLDTWQRDRAAALSQLTDC